MTVTITRLSDDATSTPYSIVLPYSLTDESRNVEHDLLSGELAITLVAPRPASGVLTFLYQDEATARAGRTLHLAVSAFMVQDSVTPGVDMNYVVGSGGVTLTLDEGTRRWWTLEVSFREVDL